MTAFDGTEELVRSKAVTTEPHAPAGDLDRFFNPRSVVIVGLSRDALQGPNSVLTTLQDFGYEGRIRIVNPHLTPGNDTTFATIADLPEAADLAIIVVGRARVQRSLEECADRGIGAAIVVTQGFADADEEGARLQEAIAKLTRSGRIRVIGPNTMGVANAFSGFTSAFVEIHREPCPIGVVSQSGLFMMGHHIINNEPAGFGLAVDLGNACDVGLLDVLAYYRSIDRLRVIQIHIESIRDGRAFIDVVSETNCEKPVIVFKAGASEPARKAIESHSGAAAGESAIYHAAFRSAGLTVAESAEDLRTLSKAFATYPPPKGRRVAVMSFSGGAAILAVDALAANDLKLADLSPESRDALTGLFPRWMDIGNPLDIWMAVSKDFHNVFPGILRIILEDDRVDSVLCIYPSFTQPKYASYDVSGHIRRLAGLHVSKPILCWSYGLDVAGATRRIETDGNVMVFPSLADAARSVRKLAEYRERQEAEGGARPPAAARRRLPRPARRIAPEGGYPLVQGLELLSSYGIPVAPWRFCRDERGLVESSEGLRFPLCLKIVSTDVLHKSDVGGVKLGIATEAELLRSYRDMLAEVRKASPETDVVGVVVQEMAQDGKEVMIGMKRDSSFGPCLIFGAGGIYTEYLADYSFRLAPVAAPEAGEMIREVRFGRIVEGVRGEPACDLAALAGTIERVSRLVCDHPEITELDINPLIVTPRGVCAVDARIIV